MAESKKDVEAHRDMLVQAITDPVVNGNPMAAPEYLRWLFIKLRGQGNDPRVGFMRGLHALANRLEDAVGAATPLEEKETIDD